MVLCRGVKCQSEQPEGKQQIGEQEDKAVKSMQSQKEKQAKRKVLVTQSCPTLRDPMAYTVREILQARILEWVAFSFSRESSQPRDASR